MRASSSLATKRLSLEDVRQLQRRSKKPKKSVLCARALLAKNLRAHVVDVRVLSNVKNEICTPHSNAHDEQSAFNDNAIAHNELLQLAQTYDDTDTISFLKHFSE